MLKQCTKTVVHFAIHYCISLNKSIITYLHTWRCIMPQYNNVCKQIMLVSNISIRLLFCCFIWLWPVTGAIRVVSWGQQTWFWAHVDVFRIEMGRSSVDAEVRPKDSAECSAWFGSARQHETKFGRSSANIRRHCGFELMAFCARRWR